MRLDGARGVVQLVASGALAALGCSAPVIDDTADANGAVTQGMVLVERSAAEGAAPQTNVSAKFMRLPAAADPELAERVVGSPFDRPPAGSCQALGASADEPSGLGAAGPIELLDAGDVTVRTGLLEMPLAARAFPDVGDLVFGVFYTSRDAASELPAPARYVFESSGSGLLERFSFEVEAPYGPEEVQIGDVDLAESALLEEGVSAVVRWRAPETSQADDRVYVDVIAASGAAVRCAFADTGRGVIPGSALRAQTLGPLPASVDVAVRRVREVPFVAPGMDLGEARFDLSVIGRATVVPH
jgi:hypothetical protein